MLNKVCVVTFSGSEIHKKYQEDFHRQYSNNFERHKSYTYDWLKTTDFYWNNQQIFQYEKYAGYFLWKPFIIRQAMKDNPGYNILYCDSNLRFTNFPAFENVFTTLMDNQGAFFVKHDNFINRDWTKRDCFFMMDADSERYHNARQVWSPLMGFDDSSNRKLLIQEYLFYCKNPQIVTEEPNVSGENLPGFREHRWEQSVMSILVEKYGYNGIPDSQIMKWVTKEYSPELMKMKELVNANPLSKDIQTFRPNISN
jgi:hypothetical protein